MSVFTSADLARILTVAAGGTADGAVLTDKSLDVPLADLGYDSLALLETVSRIERELGVRLDESAASADLTPRELLGLVDSVAPKEVSA